MSVAEDFKDCTVRLRQGRVLLGTGFFVGPGLVVTCAHVVDGFESVDLDYGGHPYPGTVIRKEIADAVEQILFPDIALISVSSVEGSAVELEDSFEPDDSLLAWGYPEEAPNGDSMNGTCEGSRCFGSLRSQTLIKFKLTQVAPGSSGSPLLNLRTGRVCGMLKRTRSQYSAEGGFGIRAEALLALSEIEEAQRRLETPLKRALRGYLSDIMADCSKLPRYFPKRLKCSFDQIRQRVRLITDRDRFYRLAEERERRRAAGDWQEQYDPMRARPEQRSLGYERPGEERFDVADWDRARAEDRFRRLAILGDPGFGKSWLLRYEALTRAQECQIALNKARPRELTVPVLVKLQDLAWHVHKSQTLIQTLDCAFESSGIHEMVRCYFGDQLRSGTLALLLDAWDEVDEHAPRDRRRMDLSCSFTGPSMSTWPLASGRRKSGTRIKSNNVPGTWLGIRSSP
jgi:hypothetical protein